MHAWTFIICLAAQLPLHASAEPLQHNPFERPALNDDRESAGDYVTYAERPIVDLRATLVGAGGALANIGGKLFSEGANVDGYLIQRIEEGRVVLAKGEHSYSISVRDEEL